MKNIKEGKNSNSSDRKKDRKDNIFGSGLPLIFIALLCGILAVYFGGTKGAQEITYSEFIRKIESESKSFKEAHFDDNGSKVKLISLDNEIFEVKLPKNLSANEFVLEKLRQSGIETKVMTAQGDKILLIVMNLLPVLLILPLILFMFRGIGGGGQAFSFVRSKAKLFKEENIKITFDDVAGVDEAKKELEEVVEFLKNPDKFKALGAKIPKGILLVGAPGTGKTLLARAIAGEAKVPFFSISGSDFVEMFVGVGASRVRDLFEQARKEAPCIVFVDEIDAVGRQRGIAGSGSHDEREQTLNQFLVEMDGFEENKSNVIILAATNRPDVLDKALTRPGRFDREVVIDYPDSKGRLRILEVHSKGKKLSEEVDLSVLAKRTQGFTGAQLANVMNEAALIAASKDKKAIDENDLDEAVDKVWMGVKRNLSIPFKELEMTAYHETGHALLAIEDKSMPLHKVTIIPRSSALGVTWSLSKDDYVHWTRKSLLTRIKVSLGGMAAEELVFDDTTAGVMMDLENATKVARQMIMQFGMSPLGPISFGKERENFLGTFGYEKHYSEDTAKKIDDQVQEILKASYEEVKEKLTGKRKIMDAIVLELLKKETLELKDVEEIIRQVEEESFPFDEARKEVEQIREKITAEKI